MLAIAEVSDLQKHRKPSEKPNNLRQFRYRASFTKRKLRMALIERLIDQSTYILNGFQQHLGQFEYTDTF